MESHLVAKCQGQAQSLDLADLKICALNSHACSFNSFTTRIREIHKTSQASSNPNGGHEQHCLDVFVGLDRFSLRMGSVANVHKLAVLLWAYSIARLVVTQ